MSSDLSQRLGRKIKFYREQRGFTQLQLAELLGKGVETISNIERGKTLPGLVTLDQMALHLAVSLKSFFDEKTQGPSAKVSSPRTAFIKSAAESLNADQLKAVEAVMRAFRKAR